MSQIFKIELTDNLLKKVEPAVELLKKISNPNVYVAGGFFKDVFTERQPKDIDLFFVKNEGVEEVKRVLCSLGYENVLCHESTYEEDNRRVEVFKNKNSFIKSIDVVSLSFGHPIEIIHNFDFSITQFALRLSDEEIKAFCSNSFFHDLYFKKIDLVTNKISERTLRRVIRYMDYGFVPTEKTIQKLLKNKKTAKLIEEEELQALFSF